MLDTKKSKRPRVKDQEAFIPTELTPEQRQRWGVYAPIQYGDGKAPHWWRRLGEVRDRMNNLINKCRDEGKPVDVSLLADFHECDRRQADFRDQVSRAEEEWSDGYVDYDELAELFENRFRKVIFGEVAMHMHADGNLPTSGDPDQHARERLVNAWGEEVDE